MYLRLLERADAADGVGGGIEDRLRLRLATGVVVERNVVALQRFERETRVLVDVERIRRRELVADICRRSPVIGDLAPGMMKMPGGRSSRERAADGRLCLCRLRPLSAPCRQARGGTGGAPPSGRPGR